MADSVYSRIFTAHVGILLGEESPDELAPESIGIKRSKACMNSIRFDLESAKIFELHFS
jgi:hypothetical protein